MKRWMRVVGGREKEKREEHFEWEYICKLTSAGLTIEPLRIGSDSKQRIGTVESLT